MIATNHPEALALLRTILEGPGDIAARLIYADWLEEHGGQEWAEFMRLAFRPKCTVRSEAYRHQLTLVRQSLGNLIPKSYHLYLGDRPELRSGVDLVDSLGDAAWLCSERDICVIVRHGLISEIGCHARWFVRVAPTLFSLHPIRAVRFHGKSPDDGIAQIDGGGPYFRHWGAGPPGGHSAVPCEGVFQLLTGELCPRARAERQGYFWEQRLYPDATTAWRDLSRATVAWARRQVQPPLPDLP